MTRAGKNLALYFSGSVEDKLAAARQLFAQYGSKLLRQHEIINGLNRLRQCGIALNAQMQAMEMGHRCSTCAAKPGGGCCSSYMADNTDAVLLLINQLMGITLTFRHNSALDCGFLGSRGCTLKVKPIFCLNYNCSHIKNAAASHQMQQLEQLAATLLGEQTAMETLLLEQLE